MGDPAQGTLEWTRDRILAVDGWRWAKIRVGECQIGGINTAAIFVTARAACFAGIVEVTFPSQDRALRALVAAVEAG